VTQAAWTATRGLGLSHVLATWPLHCGRRLRMRISYAAAARLAEGPQPDVLPCSAGILLLFANNWRRQSICSCKQAGRWSRGTTHYSIVKLMSTSRTATAAEVCTNRCRFVWQQSFWQQTQPHHSSSIPLIGHWSQNAYNLRVTPGVNLPLHCQPTHTWGKRLHSQLQCCLQQL